MRRAWVRSPRPSSRILGQGDHALISDGIYGRTIALVGRQLARWGIDHSLFDPTDREAARSLVNPRTRMIFVETITNPLLRVADLDALGDLAREAGIPLVVDNTFAPVDLPAAGARGEPRRAFGDEDDRRP